MIAELDTGTAVKVSVENAELDQKLKLIFQLTIQTPNSNYGPVRKMFQRVCAHLNAIDWSPILKTTDDFVVLPVDDHGEMELLKDVVACIPHATIQKLVERRFLPRIRLS